MVHGRSRTARRLGRLDASEIRPQVDAKSRACTLPFTDLNDACKGLLVTTAEVLNASGLRYVVAGGWVPLLAEPDHPRLVHPGTRDVDVLMTDEPAAVKAAANALLAARFRPSAKHEFQLLRDARVGERDFVFNIDLMHPHEAGTGPETFSDIFDLGVSDDYDPSGSRHMKSIAFRSAAIVYEQGLFTNVSVTARSMDDVERTVIVPILSPAAAILSKCESVSIKKRTRDAFDIYYMLSGSRAAEHATELRGLSNSFRQVSKQLQLFRRFLRSSPDTFVYNVSKHARRSIPKAASEVLAALF